MASETLSAPGAPHPSARHPSVYEPTVTGLPHLRQYIAGLWGRRRFIWHLARTDLKAEHYNTALGQLWVILDPLLLAAVYYFLRTVVRPPGANHDRSLVISHLIWAVFFFTYTQRALMQGSRSILNGRQLVLNASFPRATLPLVSIVKAFVDFVPTLLVYFVFQAALGQPFGAPMLLLPLIIAMLTVFNFGLALLFAPMMVFFRDTGGFLPYATRIWLYMTPVLFATWEIPDDLLRFLRWNPLYPFFAALEQIFRAHWPSKVYLAAAGAVAIVTFFVGALVFLVRERDFAVRL
jgi:teichoic acid transport system permease protein